MISVREEASSAGRPRAHSVLSNARPHWEESPAGEIKSLRQTLATKHPLSIAYGKPGSGSPAAMNASTGACSFSSHWPKAILEPMTGRVTSASLVGRQEELGRLHLALQSAAAGEPTCPRRVRIRS